MSLAQKIIAQVEQSLIGKPDAVRLAVACFLAEGHLLIDDIPGVGKTTLALSLARAIGGTFQRVQFTSDLLPSDVLGVSVYHSETHAFEFKKGPIFHHVVLADEINRASPKTQSALLEAMQEKQVSIDNYTHELERPFFVIATQNPHDFHGTFPLPESQLDRFLMRIRLGYPETATELKILKEDGVRLPWNEFAHVEELIQVRTEIERIKNIAVDGSLDDYLVRVAQATRESTHLDLGLSPRGTLALRRAAQAFAATHDRAFVIPDDIKAVALSVIPHRLRLKNASARTSAGTAVDAFVSELLDQLPIPH